MSPPENKKSNPSSNGGSNEIELTKIARYSDHKIGLAGADQQSDTLTYAAHFIGTDHDYATLDSLQ